MLYKDLKGRGMEQLDKSLVTIENEKQKSLQKRKNEKL